MCAMMLTAVSLKVMHSAVYYMILKHAFCVLGLGASYASKVSSLIVDDLSMTCYMFMHGSLYIQSSLSVMTSADIKGIIAYGAK
jgi:hypothetical protein